MPFAGFENFSDCQQAMKKKGLDSTSADKVCGKLQSKTKGAKLTTDEYFDALKSAIKYNDCIDQAKEYGHDDSAAKRICDTIVNDQIEDEADNGSDEDTEKDASIEIDIESDDGEEDDDEGEDEQKRQDELNNPGSDDINAPSGMSGQVGTSSDFSQTDVSNSPNLKGKKKKKHADLQLQNSPTVPGKLDNYLDQEAIDWKSDVEADYNEKSDTKKIDLSYYDDDINKCVDEQVKNGLSQENARDFCQNLANYEGDGAIKDDSEQDPIKYENREYVTGTDTGSHTAAISDVIDDQPGSSFDDQSGEDLQNCIDDAMSQDDSLSEEDATQQCQDDLQNAKNAANKMIENCVKAKMKHDDKLSEEDATKECNDAFKDSSRYDAELMDAYFTRDKENQIDPLVGGDEDIPHEDPVEGHGENNIDKNPHSHDMSADGPTYDHFGNRVIDTADVGTPDTYQSDHNSTLDDNGHIETHMDEGQKGVGQQLSDIPAEKDSDSAMGLAQDVATGNIVKKGPAAATNNGITLGKTDSIMGGPSGASANKTKNARLEGQELTHKEWLYAAAAKADEDAVNIVKYIKDHYNGSYESYIADIQLKPFEQNNKLFVKAFLMDSSVNQNQWGVSNDTLSANIRSYIGKPLVLQDNFDHPISQDDNLQHQLEYQELFRIGTIVDVVQKGTRYDAVAEITDPYAQKAFKEGDLPLYVSPQLYKLDGSEPDNAMTKWTGTHLAIVANPAYGIKLATVNGECTGDSNICVAYLKKASLIKQHGYGTCGFCNYKVLSSVKQKPKLKEASKKEEPKKATPTAPPMQVYTTPTIMTPTPTGTAAGTLSTITIPYTFSASTAQPISSLDRSSTKDNSLRLMAETSKEQPDVNKVLQENEKLKQQLLIAKKSNEEHIKQSEEQKKLNDKLSTRVANIEMERRKERIANILQAKYEDEELTSNVEIFAKSGLPVEDIAKLVSAADKKKKKDNGDKEDEDDSQMSDASVKTPPVKNAAIKQILPKVAMKNASIESTVPEKPAWLFIQEHLNGGNA